MNLRTLINRIRRIIFWLWRGKFHILTFLVVVTTLLYLFGWLNFYPNIVAAILSIVGLFIILQQQLLDAREFADHRPNTMPNWLGSYPTGKPITASLKTTELELSALKANATSLIAEDSPIEKKVAFLLAQANNLQTALGKIDGRIDDINASVTKNNKEFKDEFDKLNSSLKAIIAGHVVGDYDFNMFGITITICGTLIQFFRS